MIVYNNKQRMKTMDKKTMKEKSNIYTMNECTKILSSETNEQTNKWFRENEISSYLLRNQKANYTIDLANQVLIYIHDKEEFFLHRLVNVLNNSLKSYEYCRFLKHFSQRDSEFNFIYDVALGKNNHPIEFYLKCRSHILKSFLNKSKKELMSLIVGDESEWFKVMSEIFKKQKEEDLVELYISIVKKHYKQIKKNQNENLNGGQVFIIAQIMREKLPAEKQEEYENVYLSKVSMSKPPPGNSQNKGVNKNILTDLQVDDRQFIRALSYKDENIAKLLQQKHNNMIEMITEEVEEMRRDIEQEKRKYMQIIREKDAIMRAGRLVSECGLLYMEKNSLERENKLLEAIRKFNNEHLSKELKIEKTKEILNERRMIEQIQTEQRQID